MKTSFKLLQMLIVGSLISLTASCDSKREAEHEDTPVQAYETEDTAQVVKTGKTAEQQLEEFRSWMNNQVDKGDTAISKEWPKIREGIQKRNADLERNFDSLSEKSQEEYRQLKKRYENWETRQERRQQQPLNTDKLNTLKQQLLREHQDINKISAATLREAYLTFMGGVRAKRRNWTLDDWDHVDNVYGQLNQRFRQLDNEIRTADKLKIRSLQAEYLALEGSADTQNMIQGVGKER